MNAVAQCTVSEKVLLAAHALEEAGRSAFSAEELIVSAWKKYPKTFGLTHFAEQYPDSNKVLSSVMGGRGLTKRGWLAKVGEKCYSLTREGRQVVRRLQRVGEEDSGVRPKVVAVKLTRDQELLLQGLLASSAVTKFREGRPGELTFADACRYWGITENLHGDDLDARLAQFEETLAVLDRVLGKGQSILPDGRSVSIEDIGRLGELHALLEQRFDRHLNLVRTRMART